MDVEARGEPLWSVTACADCNGGGTCPGCRGRRTSFLVISCLTRGGRCYCRSCRGTGEVLAVKAAHPGRTPEVVKMQRHGPFKRFARARRQARQDSGL